MYMTPALRTALMALKNSNGAVFASLGMSVGYKSARLAIIVDNPKEKMLCTRHAAMCEMILASVQPVIDTSRRVVSLQQMAEELSEDLLADEGDREFGVGILGFLERAVPGAKEPITSGQKSRLYQLYGMLQDRRRVLVENIAKTGAIREFYSVQR